jgi:tRNA modification GTPase
MYRADTIVARATAAGRAAVAIVRLSGTDSLAIAGKILVGRVTLERVERWQLARFTLVDPVDSCRIDDVLAVAMSAPKTYTGEDVVEIHCHGSPVIADTVIRLALREGARSADPGEFTRRAYLNGRIDLVQAEAVADLIDAPVLAGVKAAWARLAGSLSEVLTSVRDQVVGALAEVEAHIDFTDDDLPEEAPEHVVATLQTASDSLTSLVSGFAMARREQQGYRVVLVGQPNVGKSSLLNALLGFERVVVSDEPGTTRDTIAEVVDLDGYPICIIDTAGVRETEGLAEKIAVEHAHRAVGGADVVVRVLDSSRPLDPRDDEVLSLSPSGASCITVLNKMDLPAGLTEIDRQKIEQTGGTVAQSSAVAAGGCDDLKRAVMGAIAALRGNVEEAGGAGLGRERHRVALERTLAALITAKRQLVEDQRSELAALELRQALRELASVTDAVDDERVLDEIFSKFCIGK